MVAQPTPAAKTLARPMADGPGGHTANPIPPLQLALGYIAQGIAPIPVPFKTKRPLIVGWENLRITADTAPQFFNGQPVNIGGLLGKPSNGLIDVDLDCVEAITLADNFLPPTPAVFGRASKPRSHRLYRVAGDPGKTQQHKYKTMPKNMIVEYRSTGAQTILPGSVHESDEEIRWDSEGEPPQVDAAELAAAVANLAAAVRLQRGETPKAIKREQTAPTISTVSIADRARKYINKMPAAVSGEGGHNQTFNVACELFRFGLSSADAWALLLDYNARCIPPWQENELRHKLEDAQAQVESDGETGKHVQDKPKRPRTPAPHTETEPESSSSDTDLIELGARDPADGKLILSPKRTLPTAQAYVRQFHQHDGQAAIVCYAGQLLALRGNCYRQIEDEAIRSKLQPWLHDAKRYIVNQRTGESSLTPFDSNPATIKAALESIRDYTHLATSITPPAWLDYADDDPDPKELLIGKTNSLHIPTGRVITPTPNLFATAALDFDYRADAPPPHRWLKFMHELWPDDPESIDTLQDWFGYCLTQATHQQKMLLIVGPKRSGKGTLARVLTNLIGIANTAGPTTNSLAGPFGLQPLIGKSLAIVSDARFHGDGVATVTERLLCISGEDTLTIDRKFLGAVTMKLPTRFLLLTNELPCFSDSSGALAGRFIILRLTHSFYGHEDTGLTNALLTELPGILLWAIDGWKRLQARGNFAQPSSVADAIRELEDLASPVGAFVRECCTVGPGYRVWCDDLYQAWQRWQDRDGRTTKTTNSTFGRDLAAAVPGVVRRRGAGDMPFYSGIVVREGF